MLPISQVAIVGEICRAHLVQISLEEERSGGLRVKVGFRRSRCDQ
ncbi:hypothetical protein [Aquipseudomonas campi]|nr:hypothetical protein [Pseudomonas campi]